MRIATIGIRLVAVLALLSGVPDAWGAPVMETLDTNHVTEDAGNTGTHAVEVDGVSIHAFDTTEDGAERTTAQSITDPGSDIFNYQVDFVHTSIDADGAGNMFFLEIGGTSGVFARVCMNRLDGNDRFGRSDGTSTQISNPQNLASGVQYRASLYINKTGNALDYIDPSGSTQTLGDVTYDVWFGTATGALSIIQDGQGIEDAAATNLNTVWYRMRSVAKIRYDSVWSPIDLIRATLTTESNTVSGLFTVDVAFTEDVAGLAESDFDVTNGTVTPGSLTGSGSVYSIEINPLSNGTVTVRLPAGSATNVDGDETNVASDPLSVIYSTPGSDHPVATLSTASATVTEPFTVDLTFSEAVTGMALGDLVISNGTASALQGTVSNYTFTVSPIAEGDVTVDLPAGSVTDTDGDNLQNPAAETLTVTYGLPENPVTALYGPGRTTSTAYEVFITFSREVTGLDDSDFLIVNGTASGTVSTSSGSDDTHLTGLRGRFYKTTISAAKPGTVEVTLPAGVVNAVSELNEPSLASSTLVTVCASDFGEAWVVDDAAGWTAATGSSTNLTISGGFAEPIADSAIFTSTIKTYMRKHRAASLTLTQSPVWDNWTGVADVGPSGAKNAPIFLPVADKDYYFLAESSTRAYYAWHSTNMVTWTGPARVTEDGESNGRWTTSAEYKDGTFYVLHDGPNDEDPALYMDDDLMDGVVGTKVGTVFNDPSHGSDSALIRSDEDGLFHIIYEDWSPIKASTHSWDSPLAGHTSSPDGITGFDPHEHQPPVDQRTTPSGTFDTYTHPNGTYTYEIHEPAQDAFGDWTAIKIGSQFYLFGDYDEHDGGIKVARFTSDSIYKEFALVGSLGDGHPDPTVGFAEGQFYLVTQQSTDYVSPGPWVDGVEARAGVDTNGNGVIDQWTDWQMVSESYDHKPGYARVVHVTPARLDLSGLPAGYGFQFAFRVDNTVVSGVSPIMDRVELSFEPGNFQQWANANDTPAVAEADHNGNGVQNLIEFAMGQASLPLLQTTDMTLDVVTAFAALEEEYGVEIEFSEDLSEWKRASIELPPGVSLQEEMLNGDGDMIRRYSFADSLRKLFWRIRAFGP